MQGTINDTPVRAVTGAGSVSAVSWGAILAGTAVAAASSLLLFALAVGLDLASVSSWPHRGLSPRSLTTLAAITLVVTQWISAGLGGYITGRLRTSWVGTHTHEVFFRDTAHGFITWCVATVLLASGAVAAVASSPTAALQRGAGVVLGTGIRGIGTRSLPVTALPSASVLVAQPEYGTGQMVGEPGESRPLLAVTRASTGELSAGEPSVAGNPNLSLVSANPSLVETQLADEADTREAATGSVLTALSMLVGAFIASVAAAIGGRLRDLHP
jgi:hypothetical protein